LASARGGDLPLRQLIGNHLDRHSAKLNQDRPQRLRVPVASVPVCFRSLRIAELDATRLGGGVDV
jgi:hypothetical protein